MEIENIRITLRDWGSVIEEVALDKTGIEVEEGWINGNGILDMTADVETIIKILTDSGCLVENWGVDKTTRLHGIVA